MKHDDSWQSGPLRANDVQLYRVCDLLTEVVIYLMVVFSPWAFGTTQRWSIWTMNIAGYLLGLLLAIKLGIRGLKGYRPARWVEPARRRTGERNAAGSTSHLRSKLLSLLVALTFAILGYCLVSALNARATYHPGQLSFEYHNCIRWLPHSFDSGSTWFALWTYVGLACCFWAVRDWLSGKSGSEELAQGQGSPAADLGNSSPVPTRLRRLLWLLAVNGALLAGEGIAQRLENSPKLLFLVKPQIHQTAETQFGSYAYRANAAQYFNLIWPVCLGFWWALNRTARSRRNVHHLLLLFGALIAACPMISTSRGGALIAAGIAVLAAFFLLASHFLLAAHRQANQRWRLITFSTLLLFFSGTLALGMSLGWKTLKPRLGQLQEGYEGREQMYRIVRRIAADYPLFGTGPGTYESVSELYRPSTEEFWPAQVHNDWLETRVTFGWLGSLLVYGALGTVWLRWFARGGIHGGRRFVMLVWLALAGCLIHARFDFPFQIHSILFLFLLLCAVLASLSRRSSPGRI